MHRNLIKLKKGSVFLARVLNSDQALRDRNIITVKDPDGNKWIVPLDPINPRSLQENDSVLVLVTDNENNMRAI